MESQRLTIPKPEHGSLEWLRVRHRDERGLARVSASVAACVHGEHEFKPAGDFAVELLADEPEVTETNAAMERGNVLEPVVIDWASRIIGKTLQTPQEMFCYTEPGVRLIATLDAVDGNGGVYEVKTTRKRWNGVLPRYWYWQGVQQAICAGVDKITWVIFDSDLEITFHDQIVTSDEKQIHISAVREFLSDIDLGEIPAAAELSYENVTKLNLGGEPGQSVELEGDVFALLEELRHTQGIKKMSENREAQLKAQIARAMGEAEFGTIDGNVAVTWKHQSRTSFDQKRFQAEHPALFEKFQKSTKTRVMRIINKGEDK